MQDGDMADNCRKQNMVKRVAINATDKRANMLWDMVEIGLDTKLEDNVRGMLVDPLFMIREVTKYTYLK